MLNTIKKVQFILLIIFIYWLYEVLVNEVGYTWLAVCGYIS